MLSSQLLKIIKQKEVKMKIFDIDFLEIPFADMKDDIVVCHDPQNRLAKLPHFKGVTWCVVKTNSSGEYEDALGLFWSKEMATAFAESL